MYKKIYLDLKDLRSNCFKTLKQSFQILATNQQQILLNHQKKKYGGTSFVHANIINALTEKANNSAAAEQVLLAFSDCHHKCFEAWGQKQENAVKKLKEQFNQLKFNDEGIKDVRILTETLFDYYDQMHYVQFTQSFCNVIESEFQMKMQAHEILISPELVNLAGIHILCTILSFSDFLYSLYNKIKDKSEELQKQLREESSIRVVKLLMTKRKYIANSYKGRHLIRPAELTENEIIFKKFFDLLILHHGEKEEDLRLHVKIKRVATDMHFHMTQLKKDSGKLIFDKHQVKKIYDLCRHKDFSAQSKPAQQRANEFYDRPYVTCKNCLETKFKCKSCLEDLVGKLKQLRKQQQMAALEQKKRNARSFAVSRMDGLQSGQETAKAQKAMIVPAKLQQPLMRLSSLKAPPTLHHALIELPVVVAERAQQLKNMANRADHRKIKSISNIHTQKIFDQQQRSSILNKMFVHTLQAPNVEKSTIIVKQENKQRNMKQKQIQKAKRELQADTFLPEIKQLNITERGKMERPDFTTIIQQSKEKPTKSMENHNMMERRQSIAAAMMALPVSAWQTDIHMAQQDIFN